MAKQVNAPAQPAATKTTQATTLAAKPAVATSTATPQRLLAGEESIRFRAYLKWEAAGRPVGDGRQFWLEAERELRASK